MHRRTSRHLVHPLTKHTQPRSDSDPVFQCRSWVVSGGEGVILPEEVTRPRKNGGITADGNSGCLSAQTGKSGTDAGRYTDAEKAHPGAH
jgi:hypothetical protein